MDDNNNFTLHEDINGPLLAAVIGIEMLAGLITNSFVLILTFCYLKAWKQPSNIFLTNLLVSNLIAAVFIMPFPIITCVTGEWIFGSTLRQKVGTCKFSAFLIVYNITVTTEGLVLVSFDRFFFIVKALQYKKYMTAKKAVIIVAVSWILAAILGVPPLFGFGKYEFAYSYGMCTIQWDNKPKFAFIIFVTYCIFIGSIIITSIWTFIYTSKYLRSRSLRKSLLSTHKQRNSLYVSQEKKLIGLFGMLLLVHLLCYSPLLIIALLHLIVLLPLQAYTTSFVTLLSVTSLCPLVQSYFRADVRKVIFKCRSETENSYLSSSGINESSI